MRLDPLLDSFYVLGSLWGMLPGSQTCLSSSSALDGAADEAVWSPGAPAGVLAFVDVNVIPMDTERVLPGQTVLVEGGRITALGPAKSVKVPAGAVRIDGRGKYLLPGLADMHTHFLGGQGKDNPYHLLRFVANGITAIRHTNPVTGTEGQKYRQAKTAEEDPSPYIYLAGRMYELTRSGMSPDSVAAAYKAAGYNFLIEAGSDSIQAAALRLGLPRGIHLPHNSSFEQMLALGRGTAVEHLYRFWTALGLPEADTAVTVVSEPKLRELAATTQRAGIWVTPTLSCMTGRFRLSSAPPARVKALRQIVKALQDAGVGLLLAGDDGGDVHDELATLVLAGLTPYQALATGTRNVAQYMGLLDSTGTVAVGKRADLVLLYGNPLENMKYTREPAGVMLGGRWLDRAELDRRLLASPKWFTLTVNPSGFGIGKLGLLSSLTKEQSPKVREHMKQFEALTDSLAAAQPKSSEHDRVLRRMAEELGGIRANLTPEQHVIFDPLARVWLRDQARKGNPIAIAGVTPTP